MPQSSFLYAQEVVKTAADRLDALGQMLYGENWVTPMARDLNIPRDMISKWALAKLELPPDHSIFTALACLVHHHDKGVAKACKIMDLYQA
jgi:hypothetical protein